MIDKINGKIEFRNVWFAYEGENWILKNVSFIVNPGESIALVGKTGSGKTTITNLLNRFYEIQKGDIFIDDINIKDININNKYALVIGNEGRGMSSTISDLCDKYLYIKMNNEVESLNAAVAASILLYEMDDKYDIN